MEITDLVFIDSTGYHFSDYPTFFSWLQNEYRAIYGADVYLEPDSQDGQFLAVLARAFFDLAALGSATYNSFTPGGAQGTGLSRLVKINGLRRQIPSMSTVTLTIVGTAGTVISNGVASDVLGQKWLLPATVTIPGPGTIDVTAVAAVVGFITAEASTINSIFTPTRGWQTVNNAAAATPGDPVEPDAVLRVRQTISTANPSLTVFEGTIGGVSNLTGVTKVKGYENDTGSTDLNGIPAHSISLIVVGGANQDIGNEIALHKTPGTGTFGDTPVNVVDNHGMPLTIHFGRSITATIKVQVTISAGTGWTTDFEVLIQDAVAAVINAGAIGDEILLTKLYAPAYLNGTPAGLTFDIASIEIAKNAGSFAAANIVLAYNENPVCDPNTNVTIIVT